MIKAKLKILIFKGKSNILTKFMIKCIMVIKMNAREVSLKVLLDIEDGEVYSNLLLNSKLNTVELSDLDKAFVTKLVYGVITYKRTIDFIIAETEWDEE